MKKISDIFKLLTTSALAIIFSGTSGYFFAQVEKPIPQSFTLQINGQVRYAGTSKPAENVLVRIENFNGGLIAQVTTDRGGKFNFRDLNPTQYIITAHQTGYFDARENVNLATSNSGYLNLELTRDKNSVANAGEASKLGAPAVIDASVPLEARSEFEKGSALLNEKNKPDEAIMRFENALTIYPKYLEAQLMLGLAEMDLRNWEKAENALLKTIEINRKASTAYFALGEVYYRRNKLAEAQKILLEAISLNADHARGHLLLAKVFWDLAPTVKDERQKRIALESSWQEANRALQLAPDLAEAHLVTGNLLLRAGRSNDALAQYEQYLKLEPKGDFAASAREVIKKIEKSLNSEK